MPSLAPDLLQEEPAGFPIVTPEVQAQRDQVARALKTQELANPGLLPQERAALTTDVQSKGMPTLASDLLQEDAPAPDSEPVPLEMTTHSGQGEPSVAGTILDAVKPVGEYYKQGALGMLHGAANIGSTLLTPFDRMSGPDANAERRASIGQFFKDNADTKSVPFHIGDFESLLAGTAGVGPLAGGAVKAVGPASAYTDMLANALTSGGMKLGAPAGTAAALQLATRLGAGGAVGGGSAALADPSTAGAGAALGAAIPVVGGVAYKAGSALINALKTSPEVAALADKAAQYGIDVPADRIAQSKPLDALAASLKYVPGSGRLATEDAMQNQFNRALTRTFGQDSTNVTQALRNADADLGGKFDSFLKSNTVKVDPQFQTDLADTLDKARLELNGDDFGIIKSQVDDLLSKAKAGEIDGQAAYNVKKNLDRLSKRNSNEAWYAGEIKSNLMDALNRSVGPDSAAEFSQVRQQYGAMRTLERLAKNGADGDISPARLANMHDIRNPQIQDLADISAQFLKQRENDHGAAQRVFGSLGLPGVIGGGAAGAAAWHGFMADPVMGTAGLGAAMAGGRAANSLLNSRALRSVVMPNGPSQAALIQQLMSPGVRALPIVPALQGQDSGRP